jgi:hypothetical protein
MLTSNSVGGNMQWQVRANRLSMAFGGLSLAFVLVAFWWVLAAGDAPGFLPVRSIAFSPKGDFLAAGCGLPARIQGGHWKGTGELRVWETTKWSQQIFCKDNFNDAISSVFFNSDSFLFCVSSKLISTPGNPFDGIVIRSWNLIERKEGGPIHFREGFRGQSHHQEAFSPAKDLLAVAGMNNSSPPIYDLRKQTLTFALPRHISWGFAFAPDGTVVVSCAGERPALRLFDSANGQLLAQRDLGESLAGCAQFSPDGKYVVAIGRAEFDKGKIVRRPGGTRIHVLRADLQKELVNIASPYTYLQKELTELASPDAYLAECPLAVAPDSQSFAVKSSVAAVS